MPFIYPNQIPTGDHVPSLPRPQPWEMPPAPSIPMPHVPYRPPLVPVDFPATVTEDDLADREKSVDMGDLAFESRSDQYVDINVIAPGRDLSDFLVEVVGTSLEIHVGPSTLDYGDIAEGDPSILFYDEDFEWVFNTAPRVVSVRYSLGILCVRISGALDQSRRTFDVTE